MSDPNPEEDLLEESGHIDSMECWCKPDVIFVCEWNGGTVIVHKGAGEELPPPFIIAAAIAEVISGKP